MGTTGFRGFGARLGAKHEPIRSFHGPNLAEAGRGEVAATFMRMAAMVVGPAAIGKHLAKFL